MHQASGSGCGGQGCGGLFGAESNDKKEWSYVGEGRGGYEKVETLVWVGEGNGTYDREERARAQARGGGYRRLYMSIMLMLVLAGAVLDSAAQAPALGASTDGVRCGLADQAAPEGAAREPRLTAEVRPQAAGLASDSMDRVVSERVAGGSPVAATTRPQAVAGGGLDCSLPRTELSMPHRMWCCAKKGTMCPELDCDAGLSDWRRSWSDGKKIWCCRHRHKGCEDLRASPSPARPGPAAALRDGEASPPESASGTHEYSCSGSPEVWTGYHRRWCCWHFGQGCPGASPELFDCTERKQSSPLEAAWCCKKKHIGCKPLPTGA